MKNLLCLAAVMCVCTNCATITRGTKEALVIDSRPNGAMVTTSTGLTGKTPCTFKVSRSGGFVVTIEKEGYEKVQVQIESQVAGAGAVGMAGNVLLGGILGLGIDAASGATKELKPNPIKVRLEPLEKEKAIFRKEEYEEDDFFEINDDSNDSYVTPDQLEKPITDNQEKKKVSSKRFRGSKR